MDKDKLKTKSSTIPKFLLLKVSGANGLTNFADVLGLTALPLLAALITDSPAQVAGLSVIQQLPWLLFALPIGVWLDQLNRKKVYIWITIISFMIMFTFGTLIFFGIYSMIILYIYMFLTGITETVRDSASPIIVREVVGKDRLQEAYGTFTTARLTGEAIAGSSAGFLFTRSAALPFFLQSGAIVGALTLMSTLKGDFSSKELVKGESFFTKLKYGFHWLWQDKLTRHLTILSAMQSFYSRLVFAVFVLFVLNVVELSVTMYGIISIFFTVGGIIGATLSKVISKSFGMKPTIILSICWIALSYGLMAIFQTPFFSGIFMFLIAIGIFVLNIISNSIWRGLVPDDLQGRVGSVFQFFTWGVGPIGALAGGFIGSVVSLTATLWVSGVGMLVAAFYALIFIQIKE